MNGVEVAQVTTAIAMDAALEAKVLAKIATLSDKKNHNRKYSRCFDYWRVYFE
jgi:hypothetical protein